jgi:hypothetical protein
MSTSRVAFWGLGVIITEQSINNAIAQRNENLKENLDKNLYFDVDEHPDYIEPKSYDNFRYLEEVCGIDDGYDKDLDSEYIFIYALEESYNEEVFFINLKNVKSLEDLQKIDIQKEKEKLLAWCEDMHLIPRTDFDIHAGYEVY